MHSNVAFQELLRNEVPAKTIKFYEVYREPFETRNESLSLSVLTHSSNRTELNLIRPDPQLFFQVGHLISKFPINAQLQFIVFPSHTQMERAADVWRQNPLRLKFIQESKDRA